MLAFTDKKVKLIFSFFSMISMEIGGKSSIFIEQVPSWAKTGKFCRIPTCPSPLPMI